MLIHFSKISFSISKCILLFCWENIIIYFFDVIYRLWIYISAEWLSIVCLVVFNYHLSVINVMCLLLLQIASEFFLSMNYYLKPDVSIHFSFKYSKRCIQIEERNVQMKFYELFLKIFYVYVEDNLWQKNIYSKVRSIRKLWNFCI